MKALYLKTRVSWMLIVPWAIAVAAVGWALSHHQFIFTFQMQKGVVWWAVFPWQSIATIFTGAGAVFAAVHVYTRQKWWEKRVEAYQAAINAVSLLQQHVKLEIKEQYHEMENRNPTTWYSDRMKAIDPKVDEAREYMDTLVNSGPFLLSSNAIEALRQMQREISKRIKSREQDFISYLEEQDAAFATCLKRLTCDAVSDLGIKGRNVNQRALQEETAAR